LNRELEARKISQADAGKMLGFQNTQRQPRASSFFITQVGIDRTLPRDTVSSSRAERQLEMEPFGRF
jgi:hypothetical protein